MATEKKVKVVENLQETFAKSNIGILTDYRGMTTADLNDLRRKLRAAKVEYKVVKNTLARRAAKSAGMDFADSAFAGPMAVAFGYGEIQDTARALAEFIRSSKSNMKIKSGFLPDRLLTAKDVETLAKLPSKAVLISMVMAGIQSPISGLVNVLAGSLRNVMGVLQARIKQLEEK